MLPECMSFVSASLGPRGAHTYKHIHSSITSYHHFKLQVRRGGLVLDPFVGTGSILIPAAHLGAHTIGADIDARVIKIGGC